VSEALWIFAAAQTSPAASNPCFTHGMWSAPAPTGMKMVCTPMPMSSAALLIRSFNLRLVRTGGSSKPVLMETLPVPVKGMSWLSM
jgi:hypothetical protein